jgi:hypothetical protein
MFTVFPLFVLWLIAGASRPALATLTSLLTDREVLVVAAILCGLAIARRGRLRNSSPLGTAALILFLYTPSTLFLGMLPFGEIVRPLVAALIFSALLVASAVVFVLHPDGTTSHDAAQHGVAPDDRPRTAARG